MNILISKWILISNKREHNFLDRNVLILKSNEPLNDYDY